MANLLLKGTSKSQLKVLSSLGFNISLKKISAVMARIEQFCYQKAIQKLQDATVEILIDRNKNSEFLKSLSNIYLDRECSEISFYFLLEEKESLESILFEFEETKFNKDKIFEIFLSETYKSINTRQRLDSSLYMFNASIVNGVQIKNNRTLYDLKCLLNYPIQKICKHFYKFGHLLSEQYFSENAATTILRTQAKIVFDRGLFDEKEILERLEKFFNKIFLELDDAYYSFDGVKRIGILDNGKSGYGLFCPDKEENKHLFDSFKQEFSRIFTEEFNKKYIKKV